MALMGPSRRTHLSFEVAGLDFCSVAQEFGPRYTPINGVD